MGEGKMLNLAIFSSVNTYRSIRRAIKRGHITEWGEEIPKRPFNNRKRTLGRELQLKKERIYGEFRRNQA